MVFAFKQFLFIYLAQGSETSSKKTVFMSESTEKASEAKSSPEPSRKDLRAEKAPLFTSETKTIIWGLQARAVQV